MREFVFGSEENYNILKTQLEEIPGMMKCFNCILPDGCNPKEATFGFEKKGSLFILYIDRFIQTSIRNDDFVRFLNKKEVKFISIQDMMEFFHSLQDLYLEEEKEKNELLTDDIEPESQHIHVIDYEAVQNIIDEERKKYVFDGNILASGLKENVVGQDQAIGMLSDILSLGMRKKRNRLINIALLGPTATGKSETARSLVAQLSKLTGHKYGFIECAGNEFVSEHSVHRFLGAPPGYVGYGKETILEPVRKNPYHVIVINEVEKADERLLIALMEAIDTGYLGMADNSKPIDLNNSVLIFTSNLEIDMQKYNQLSDYEKNELCMDAFTKHCGRPEISGKISNYIVFQSLSDEANIAIVEKFAIDIFDSFDINLVEIAPTLAQQFVKYKTSYGARAIRTMVERVVGRQLLHSGLLDSMQKTDVKMKGTLDNIEFEIVNSNNSNRI